MACFLVATTKTMKCEVCGADVTNKPACPECGAKVSSASVPASHPITPPPPPDNTYHPELKECPVDKGGCGTPRAKITPFCRSCKFNFRTLEPNSVTPAPAAVAADRNTTPDPTPERHANELLQATISLDASLYTEPEEGITFPAVVPAPITIPIDGERVLFGRPSKRVNTVTPDFPTFGVDSGVSNQHFELTLTPDGRYMFHQLHNNGSLVNGKPYIKDGQLVIKGRTEIILGYFTRIVIEPRSTTAV